MKMLYILLGTHDHLKIAKEFIKLRYSDLNQQLIILDLSILLDGELSLTSSLL